MMMICRSIFLSTLAIVGVAEATVVKSVSLKGDDDGESKEPWKLTVTSWEPSELGQFWPVLKELVRAQAASGLLDVTLILGSVPGDVKAIQNEFENLAPLGDNSQEDDAGDDDVALDSDVALGEFRIFELPEELRMPVKETHGYVHWKALDWLHSKGAYEHMSNADYLIIEAMSGVGLLAKNEFPHVPVSRWYGTDSLLKHFPFSRDFIPGHADDIPAAFIAVLSTEQGHLQGSGINPETRALALPLPSLEDTDRTDPVASPRAAVESKSVKKQPALGFQSGGASSGAPGEEPTVTVEGAEKGAENEETTVRTSESTLEEAAEEEEQLMPSFQTVKSMWGAREPFGTREELVLVNGAEAAGREIEQFRHAHKLNNTGLAALRKKGGESVQFVADKLAEDPNRILIYVALGSINFVHVDGLKELLQVQMKDLLSDPRYVILMRVTVVSDTKPFATKVPTEDLDSILYGSDDVASNDGILPRKMQKEGNFVLASEFLPQKEIFAEFAHRTIFVSAAGVSSVTEAMAAGIPMVMLPAVREQSNNAHNMERFGIAVDLSRVSEKLVYDRAYFHPVSHYSGNGPSPAAEKETSPLFTEKSLQIPDPSGLRAARKSVSAAVGYVRENMLCGGEESSCRFRGNMQTAFDELRKDTWNYSQTASLIWKALRTPRQVLSEAEKSAQYKNNVRRSLWGRMTLRKEGGAQQVNESVAVRRETASQTWGLLLGFCMAFIVSLFGALLVFIARTGKSSAVDDFEALLDQQVNDEDHASDDFEALLDHNDALDHEESPAAEQEVDAGAAEQASTILRA